MSDSDQPKPKVDPPTPTVPQNLPMGAKRLPPPRPKPDAIIEFPETWVDKVMTAATVFVFVCIGLVFLAMAWRIVTVGLK